MFIDIQDTVRGSYSRVSGESDVVAAGEGRFCCGLQLDRSMRSRGIGVIVLLLVLGSAEWGCRSCSAQGFPGQGFPGQGFPGQGFPGQGWHGWGVPRASIDISIGVWPSHPYAIGVPRGGFFSPWPASVYPDYRAEYNLRIEQSHQAQLRAIELGAAGLPGWPHPLHQAYIHGQLSGPGESLGEPLPNAELPSAERIAQELVLAATRLDLALARRGEEGEAWRSYLSTQSLMHIADSSDTADDLITIVQNYDGVVANGNLRWVMRSDGFAETRQWLQAFVSVHRAAEGRQDDADATEFPPEREAETPESILPTPTRGRL